MRLNQFIALAFVLGALVACGGTETTVKPENKVRVGMANPASVKCVQKGGKLNIVKDKSGGEMGMCVFPSGKQCEEWALFRGECKP